MVAVRPQPLRVIEVREWQRSEVAGATLTASDRPLVTRLAAQDRVEIEELRTGLRIRTTSWVGVVRLAALEIRIVPKLVGSASWLIAMLDFAGGIDNLQRLTNEHAINAKGTNLLDLFTLLLCEACQDLWDGGLLADYVEQEDELQVVRGRLLFDRQMRERFGQVDRVICRFDERQTDIVENQLLGAALDVASRRTRSTPLRRRSRRLSTLFKEQCAPEAVDIEAARDAIVYHRLNQHYRPAHGLAWLVLDALGVTDLQAPGVTDCFAFLLNMNSLFEAFIDRVVRMVLAPHGAEIVSQRKDGSVLRDLITEKSYATVIPDLVVSGINGRRVPMDAKYKTYENDKADRGDLYQAFLYAMAYRRHHEHYPRALLLYPASDESVAVRRIAVRNASIGDAAEIRLCSVPVAGVLAEHALGGEKLDALRGALLDAFGGIRSAT